MTNNLRVTGVVGAFLVAGFAASLAASSCSSSNNANPGSAGTTGATAGTTGATAGTTAATAGTTGAAGTNVDAGVLPVDGKCPIAGATVKNGVCACSTSSPTVCGTTCINTQTDNDNCGMCGKKCPATSSCNAGTCGAEPKVLVPGVAGCNSIHLALSGTTVYWTDSGHGTVKSIGTAAGAAAMPVATGQTTPTLLAVNGTTVFWTAGMAVMKSTAGGAATMVTTGAMPVKGLAVSADGNTVYYSVGDSIFKVPAAGAATGTLVHKANDGVPGNLALEGASLAFGSDEAQDVDVAKVDGAASSCGMRDDGGNGFCINGLRLARSQGSILLDQIYLIGGKVFWAHGTDIATVSITPTATGGAMPADKISSTANFEAASALFIQGTTAYFAEKSGTVEKSPLTPNSDTTIIARGQPTPTSIVADANNIYWANGTGTTASAADCAVMTMPAE